MYLLFLKIKVGVYNPILSKFQRAVVPGSPNTMNDHKVAGAEGRSSLCGQLLCFLALAAADFIGGGPHILLVSARIYIQGRLF